MKMSIPSFKKQLVTCVRQAELKNISNISVFSKSTFYFLLLGIFEIIIKFMHEYEEQFGPAFPIIEQAYQSLLKLTQPYEKETEGNPTVEKQENSQGKSALEPEAEEDGQEEEMVHVDAYDRKLSEKTQSGKEKKPNVEELQAEIERLKGEKAFLEGKVLEEQQKSEEFRLEMLDLKLKNNPKTSHTPSSKERYPQVDTYHHDRKAAFEQEADKESTPEERNEKTGDFKPKGIGGKPGHPGHTAKTREEVEPDKVVFCYPEGWSQKEIDAHEWLEGVYHDKVEIIQQTQLTRYIQMITTESGKRGPKLIKGAFPQEVSSQLSYGLTVIKTIYIYYSIGLISVNRLAKIMQNLFGLTISPSTIQNLISKSSENFLKAREHILEAMKREGLKEDSIFGADETSVNVNGSLYWQHILVSKDYTLYTVSESRGIKGLYTSGVLEDFRGTLVCDFYHMYSDKRFRSLARCWAHLERDLAAAKAKQPGLKWVDLMLDFAEDSYKTYRQSLETEKPVTEEELEKLNEQYEKALTTGETETMVASVENLFKRFKNNKQEILAHLYNTKIPRTNNWSEQAARQIKLKLDVSKLFRTKAGVQTYDAVKTVIDTAVKQGLNPIEAISQTLGGNIDYVLTHQIEKSLDYTCVRRLEVIQGKQEKR